MQYQCRVSVIDKKVFPDLQERYLNDPKAGACPFYHVGDTFLFKRYGGEDTFWTMGKGSHCAEAWDAISRYIYTALQGGSIMRGWTHDEHMMIACCNDGTRPVIFKIERLDYKVLVLSENPEEVIKCEVKQALESLDRVNRVEFHENPGWIEVFCDRNDPPHDEELLDALSSSNLEIVRID
ncbi:TIGR04076 family protein [uncultured Dubosiella sp.]|uniref:TIGR04076 family protein n=1 Tax=uncultured Dubosiella sp. TaxID=1937011 RepID=UPI00272F1C67|nr:TIGR04076 family protein [uncultured Dubosiella sp.]